MTYMVLLLRHIDQVLRVRTSSTCECDGQFTQERSFPSGDFRLAEHSLWRLPAPGLPLCSPGSEQSWTGANSRTQKRFYRQALSLFDPTSPPAGTTTREHHQSVGGSSVTALVETSARPWLSASDSANFVAKINMSMIVCRLEKCRKFITGWFPRSPRANRPPN